MVGVKCVLILVFLTLMWTVTLIRGETQVSCVLLESCVLPCSFQPASEELILWNLLTGGEPPVHSYYSGDDQLSQQEPRYRNRTSLFKDQISGGNASLRLTEVTVEDEGRYKCYTSTIRGNKETFINMGVQAPVRKVDIQQVGETITCSSKGIYPQPELTWSTDPPSTLTDQNTTVQKDQQLYSISSSLVVSDTEAAYICTVSTANSRGRATCSKQASVSGSVSSDILIPCRDSLSDLRGFSLTWTFNHSQTILVHRFPKTQTQTQNKIQVQEPWRDLVQNVYESGSLKLRVSSGGIYTCEVSDANETYITNTLLRIESAPLTDDKSYVVGVAVVAVIVFIIIIAVILAVVFVLWKKRLMNCKGNNEQGPKNNGNTHEQIRLAQNGGSSDSQNQQGAGDAVDPNDGPC